MGTQDRASKLSWNGKKVAVLCLCLPFAGEDLGAPASYIEVSFIALK